MIFDFAPHGTAPRARLRQRALLVAGVESLFQHLSGFLQIPAHFRHVRKPRPRRQPRRNFIQMPVVSSGGVKVSRFQRAVARNCQKIRALRILPQPLLGQCPRVLKMMPRKLQLSARLQDARITRIEVFRLLQHIPAAIVVGAIAGSYGARHISAGKHAPRVRVVRARGGARFVKRNYLVFSALGNRGRVLRFPGKARHLR